MGQKIVRVLIFSNIPSPYRITLFNELSLVSNIELLVLYCAKTEPNRMWISLNINHPHKFLKENIITKKLKIKYLNKNIIKNIIDFRPDLIVTGGFFPTMMIAIIYARLKKIKHMINTDAWYINEKDYKWYHKFLRKFIYKSTNAFLPVSRKGAENFIKNYKIKKEKIFIVPYAIDPSVYYYMGQKKIYDIIFVGQFIDRKMPFFVINVINEIKKSINNLKFLIIGEGPYKEKILQELKNMGIDYYYPGYLQPYELVEFYNKSKILLFPTKKDGWGVVANEAISVGVPCITNNYAGCANELVVNEYTGYVLELDVNKWANKVVKFLNDLNLQNRFKSNCLLHAKMFLPQLAAKKFEDAVKYCLRVK